MVSSVALTGTSATAHNDDCTLTGPSAPCTKTDGSSLSTAPNKLDVLPHSDDPRWLALGYNPKWPSLGYNPKWQNFGYEPQYKGFQPRSTLLSSTATPSTATGPASSSSVPSGTPSRPRPDDVGQAESHKR
jgi:hypothetical protein